ncbi:MAG TPA: hypothetical protein VHA78_04800 [Candidatus Peribacteraceae bacterium]|nr:hypothetical protein [Candidatus Peribacteraceae bacterium]
MHKHTRSSRLTIQLPLMALGVLAIASSFALGMKTAGDVHTVAPMEASGTRLSEDINDDGRIDVRDAIAVLEVARGYKQATPDELRADPNHDGQLTIDDAIRILSDISIR